MIVIFRRIREAAGRVTGTEWLLVLVEGLLVFLGIVAAFELEQWAQQQREKKDHAQMLNRLVDEAEETVANLIEDRDRFATTLEQARAEMNGWFNHGTCPAGAIFISRFHPTLRVPTSAYEEMIGSGGLSSLPSAAVRSAVARFHGQRRYYEGQLDYFRDSVSADGQELFDLGFRQGYDAQQAGSGSYVMARDPDASCDDDRLKWQLASMMSDFEKMQSYRNDLARDAVTMCVVVADAAGRVCSPPGMELDGDDAQVARSALETMR